mmetsp:Transcript_68711/g.183404  ORF Transcript_68711/g.183404 Transcript_68711/m.183404 type:complete len:162 (+) Transcript_68711:81-566(+)
MAHITDVYFGEEFLKLKVKEQKSSKKRQVSFSSIFKNDSFVMDNAKVVELLSDVPSVMDNLESDLSFNNVPSSLDIHATQSTVANSRRNSIISVQGKPVFVQKEFQNLDLGPGDDDFGGLPDDNIDMGLLFTDAAHVVLDNMHSRSSMTSGRFLSTVSVRN